MIKNEEYIDLVVDNGINGEGIVKRDGITVFLPFCLKGEKVQYKILKVNKNIAFGKVLDVLTPSEERVRPSCSVFGKCGGCQLQHLCYSSQLKIKRNNIKTTFNKVANLDVDVLSPSKSNFEYGYRNKLQLPVIKTDFGTVIGFYAEKSHRVIEIKDCPINPSWTKCIISSFNQYIKEFNLNGYDELSNTGDIREITVKEIDSNLIITAVVLNENIKGIERLIEILIQNLKSKFSLFININDSKTNVIYGDKFILKYGKGEYLDAEFGIKFKTGVQSFLQVNKYVAHDLYSYVKDLIKENSNNDVVINAYSGAGLLTAILAKNFNEAIGVEIVKEANDCANELANVNNLSNKMINVLGNCEVEIPKLIKEYGDCSLVLDPPRKGCEYSVISSIVNSNIKNIVYISCKPSTLARDVGLICGSLVYEDGEVKKSTTNNLRYKVVSVKPFDMFPQTKHVETVVYLIRCN